MSQAPAFQLYAADFYMDTNTWSINEIGIYTRLLFSEWVNGPLPNNENRLARASGCSVKVFRAGWGQVKLKFSVRDDGKLYNERLEYVRQEQEEYKQKQSVKGQKSARKRWGKKVTAVMTGVVTGAVTNGQPECNPSSSSLKKEKERKKKAPLLPLKKGEHLPTSEEELLEFNDWWDNERVGLIEGRKI